MIGRDEGQIQWYEFEQHQNRMLKLIQRFPNEHSSFNITSLIRLNHKTLVSCSFYSSSLLDSVKVIWTKSELTSLYTEPTQRITRKETGTACGITKLVAVNDEDEFVSCSESIIIWWSRVKGEGEEGEFKLKQKIENVGNVFKCHTRTSWYSARRLVILYKYAFFLPILLNMKRERIS